MIEDGHATTWLRYEFFGYELLETQVDRERLRHAVPSCLTSLGIWLAQVPRRIAKWMLEPVDYPLKVCSEE